MRIWIVAPCHDMLANAVRFEEAQPDGSHIHYWSGGIASDRTSAIVFSRRDTRWWEWTT